MSLGRLQLLGIAHAERQRLGRMIQFAEPDTWDQPSAAAGWWNRDVIAHLGAGDTAAAQLLAGEPASELEEYRAEVGPDGFTVDGWNAWHVNRRSGTETREVLTLWGQAAESMLSHAAALSEEDWTTKRFEWLAGPIRARYLVHSRLVEWWLHGEDVRATNGLKPVVQHWPIWLTIDMGVRMLPWALGRAGIDASGKTVQFDLEGAGEGTWHWGLGSGEIPDPDHKPDAFIQGRAPQTALVAGRRLSADDVLANGTVVLGRDVELGELILRHIRAFV